MGSASSVVKERCHRGTLGQVAVGDRHHLGPGAVGKALDLLPQRPERLIVCGGGRHNPAIMAMLGTRANVEAIPAEAVGWRGDAVEAECFALLAVRVLRGLPISFPTTTGAPHALTGGILAA